MRVNRVGLVAVSCLAIASIAGLCARSSRHVAEPNLTFAQLTDAHLFDEGWNEPLEQIDRNPGRNWNALHWSIDRINTLMRSGKKIDFVVYTGDLGLGNFAFSDVSACPARTVQVEDGWPDTPEQSGSKKLIAELDRLAVRTVFFVSGANDAWEQDVAEERFDCFLLGLQERAQTLDRPLRIQKLGPDHCFALRGFHLLAVNSSIFKKTATNQGVCSQRVPTRLLQQLLNSPCPQTEIGVLREQVASGEPTLLFTHFPEFSDSPGRDAAEHPEGLVRREWEGEARKSNILGIFAGHLDSSAKSLALESSVASKTYMTPPLAVPDGIGERIPRRGFLLVTANRTGITSTEVQWFGSAR